MFVAIMKVSQLVSHVVANRGRRYESDQALRAVEQQAIVERLQQQLAAVQQSVQEERKRLQDLETTLRPNEELKLRGLVSEEVLKRHAKVLRRLRALELDSAAVLSSKQVS